MSGGNSKAGGAKISRETLFCVKKCFPAPSQKTLTLSELKRMPHRQIGTFPFDHENSRLSCELPHFSTNQW